MNLNPQQITSAADWLTFAMTHKGATMDLVQQAGEATEEVFKSNIAGLPRFTAEGNLSDTVLIYVGLEESRYRPGENSLVMYYYSPSLQQGDFYIGSLTQDYVQNGNNAGKPWWQVTLEGLARIGYDYKTQPLDALLALIGQTHPIWVKSSVKGEKTYYNIGAVGSNFEVRPPVKLKGFQFPDGGMAGAPQQQQQQAQQQQAPPPPQPQPQPQAQWQPDPGQHQWQQAPQQQQQQAQQQWPPAAPAPQWPAAPNPFAPQGGNGNGQQGGR